MPPKKGYNMTKSMRRKQYRIKFENGSIMPLEPFDIEGYKEGIIIFLDDEEDFEIKTSDKNILQKGIEFGNLIPDNEILKLPKDFSENFDSYLYGHNNSDK